MLQSIQLLFLLIFKLSCFWPVEDSFIMTPEPLLISFSDCDKIFQADFRKFFILFCSCLRPGISYFSQKLISFSGKCYLETVLWSLGYAYSYWVGHSFRFFSVQNQETYCCCLKDKMYKDSILTLPIQIQDYIAFT